MTGWPFHQVEDLRIPDLMVLCDWWAKHPPMAYSGGGTKDRRSGSDGEEIMDDAALLGMLGDAASPGT